MSSSHCDFILVRLESQSCLFVGGVNFLNRIHVRSCSEVQTKVVFHGSLHNSLSKEEREVNNDNVQKNTDQSIHISLWMPVYTP